MKLRGEAAKWIKDIDEQEQALVNGLYALLGIEAQRTGQFRGKPVPMPDSRGLLAWERIEQINFAVTYGLTAIGVCLMIGFCTRLAALGGAAFMAMVVMTQPAFPTIYPPDQPIVGHALLVDKDVIEMLALLVMVAVGAGRWGGLDFFLRACCRGGKADNRQSQRSVWRPDRGEGSTSPSNSGEILRSAQNVQQQKP